MLSFLPLILAVVPGAEPPGPEANAFFENKIRPVLVRECYSCHSAEAEAKKKLKGGLRLDSRAAVLKGGDTGPALVPGKPAESLLMEALRHEGLRMPPKTKLSDEVVADFEQWIKLGAPDPRGDKVAVKADAGQLHWAYQPLAQPTLPVVKDRAWGAAPVDAFILAKLEANGLTPSPAADRRTLIRRATYDLTGLPPTYAEVEAFVSDPSADAFAKVVDRLLASPHYGERWGRHWLDVARYADTKDGVLMYGDDRVRPYAYTYRDYVVKALNEDTPYDRFLHEQLAADQIEPKVEPWRLAAMGFLTLGRMYDGNIHDVIDDRIDTTTRAMLGLTVACARCHDHKYDPIPTADYYSMYGVFASSEAPLELPRVDRLAPQPAAEAFEKKAAPKRQEVQKFLDQQYALLTEANRSRVGDYLVRVATTKADPLETAIFFFSLAPEDLRPQVMARWRSYVARRARSDDPVFTPWQALMQLSDAEFAAQAPVVIKGLQAEKINPLVRTALAWAKLTSRGDVARTYGDLLRRVYDESKKSPPCDEPRKQLLEIVTGRDSPAYFAKAQTRRYMSRGETDAYGTKLQEIDRMAVRDANAPPRAMVLVDNAELCAPQIFVRGSPSQPGANVPRQFLRVLSPEQREPFPHGSGRLDLARAITSTPLAARVMVNRVWMHHFGEPLVGTPSDFGSRSTAPAHPELLDYLAASFQAEGWSLKKLHRTLMLTNVYQQSSSDRPDCRAVDAENRLMWRAQRRRLELEAMRDTLLAVSGRLDRTVGGRPVDVSNDPLNRRRTVYGLVDRQSLPGLFRAFDFASPDQSAERRPFTTVPQQALFGLNAAFVVEQAKALAARPEANVATPEERVAGLYRLALARVPQPDEVRLALEFIRAEEADRKVPSALTPWQQYAQVLLLTNEAMFLD